MGATTVTFGGVTAVSIVVESSTRILAVVASETPIGPGSVVVTTPGGIANSTTLFTVYQPASWSTAVSYLTGNGPRGVTIADVNQDGKPDIVTADDADNDVSVLFGLGDGGFALHKEFPAGSGTTPYSVAVGDVNEDGRLDIVTSNANPSGPGTVSVLLGSPDGGFATGVQSQVGFIANSVALVDLNGDGHLDIAAANDIDAGSVSVLLGFGDGGFTTSVSYPVGRQAFTVSVADVNADGLLDVVTANVADDDLSILAGCGDGGFADGGVLAVGHGPKVTIAADINGDGNPDLVSGDVFDQAIAVLLGTGDDGFADGGSHDLGGTTNEAFALVIVDITGDGAPDVVAVCPACDAGWILPGDGGGGFGQLPALITGSTPRSLAVGDLNGDGRADIVIANQGTDLLSSSVSVFLGQ